jgi:hypothetical protein
MIISSHNHDEQDLAVGFNYNTAHIFLLSNQPERRKHELLPSYSSLVCTSFLALQNKKQLLFASAFPVSSARNAAAC